MRKGFTLIELLAVIVILAIIALIATPIVLNIIKDSRESAGLRSAEMYLDAVEQSISVEKMKNTTFKPNECTITDKGNLDCDTKDGILEVKVNGDKPLNGIITFENGKIKDVSLEYSNNKLIVKNNEDKLVYKNYISINNFQHKHTNGTIEDHEVTFDNNGHGTCSKCGEFVLIAGTYDENGNLLQTWEELNINLEEDVNPGINTTVGKLNTNATKLVIANDVTKIGSYQFYSVSKYSNLKEIVIPDSVTSIGDRAFYFCKNLTSIIIPESVTNIGIGAFQLCENLTLIIVDKDNPIYDSRNNCNAIIETATNTLIQGCQNTTIPNTIINIGDSAFEQCFNLESIDIPDSVTSIGDSAFYDCSKLKSIYIPSSVTIISANVSNKSPFYYCSSLKIYCGANSKPSGWGPYWNYYSATGTLEVIYGVTREEYEKLINE